MVKVNLGGERMKGVVFFNIKANKDFFYIIYIC